MCGAGRALGGSQLVLRHFSWPLAACLTLGTEGRLHATRSSWGHSLSLLSAGLAPARGSSPLLGAHVALPRQVSATGVSCRAEPPHLQVMSSLKCCFFLPFASAHQAVSWAAVRSELSLLSARVLFIFTLSASRGHWGPISTYHLRVS